MKQNYITEDYFWANVDEDLKTKCWNISSLTHKDNRFHTYRFDGKRVRPHVIAWKLVKGKFPVGKLQSFCKNKQCVNPNHYIEIKCDFDRFISKITVNSETNCWEWQGFIDPNGYGNIKMGNRVMRAHRFSYSYYISKIPDGYDVLHKCDNRRCCNPAHLFLGTDQDNALDREIKGRNPHKLSPQLVKEIRLRRNSGESVSSLRKEFGLSKENMYKLLNRKSWRWV